MPKKEHACNEVRKKYEEIINIDIYLLLLEKDFFQKYIIDIIKMSRFLLIKEDDLPLVFLRKTNEY